MPLYEGDQATGKRIYVDWIDGQPVLAHF